jgi:hypothetical protein
LQQDRLIATVRWDAFPLISVHPCSSVGKYS